MRKILLLALTLFSFSGCGREPTICPQLKPLDRVPDISVIVYETSTGLCMKLRDSKNNSSICGEDAKILFNWMQKIRTSETYYREQTQIYNEGFTYE